MPTFRGYDAALKHFNLPRSNITQVPRTTPSGYFPSYPVHQLHRSHISGDGDLPASASGSRGDKRDQFFGNSVCTRNSANHPTGWLNNGSQYNDLSRKDVRQTTPGSGVRLTEYRSHSGNRVVDRGHEKFEATYTSSAGNQQPLGENQKIQYQQQEPYSSVYGLPSALNNQNLNYALNHQISDVNVSNGLKKSGSSFIGSTNFKTMTKWDQSLQNDVYHPSRDNPCQRYTNKKLAFSYMTPEIKWGRPSSAKKNVLYKSSKERKQRKQRKPSRRTTTAETIRSATGKNSTTECCSGFPVKKSFSSSVKQLLENEDNISSVTEYFSNKASKPDNKQQKNVSCDLDRLSNNSKKNLQKSNSQNPVSLFNQTNFVENGLELHDGGGYPLTACDQKPLQSNNNSIPNGTSLVSMAREMLKKNFQPPSSKSHKQSLDIYSFMPRPDRSTFEPINQNISECDGDIKVRRKASEKHSFKMTSSGDDGKDDRSFSHNKQSRTSLNTVHTPARCGADNGEKPPQLVSMPNAGVISGSKKSRMYVTTELPMKRFYQPVGVVNYLTQKYKHRQPRMYECSQGYDQTVKNVVKNLHDSWLDQSQCDVAIVTDDGEIMAHQAVLSSFSSSLSALFKANRPHSSQDSTDGQQQATIIMINMTEFSKDIVADTLHFLYTTDINLDSSNISQFVLVARRLELHVLSKICEEFLLSSSNLDNLLLHYLIANNCEIASIVSELERKIAQNFDVVWTKKHLVKLSRSLMLSLLSHEDLNISEVNKLHAVSKWIEYNRGERMKYVPELMKMVNFERIDIDTLLTTVQNLDWMFTNATMRSKMLSAYKNTVTSANVNTNQANQDDSNPKLKTIGANMNTHLKASLVQSEGAPKKEHHDTERSNNQASRQATENQLLKKTTVPTSPSPPLLPPAASPSQTQIVRNADSATNVANRKPPADVRSCKPTNLNAQATRTCDTPLQLKMVTIGVGDDKIRPASAASLASKTPQVSANREESTRHQMNGTQTSVCGDDRTAHAAWQHEMIWQRNLRSCETKFKRHHHHHHHPTHQSSPRLPQQLIGRCINTGTNMTPQLLYEDLRQPSTPDDGEERLWNLKTQGVVSLYLPNYRPPPFKQYQLTNNLSAVKYVEL